MTDIMLIFVLCVIIGVWGLESKRNNDDDNNAHRGGA